MHEGTKAFCGVEARAFLNEAHHMSNIYFMIFMMVVSYFYMNFSQFIDYFS